MAVASCAWLTKEVKGDPPAPRQGHSTALCGDKIYLFGGLSTSDDGQTSKYLNDLFCLSVTPADLTWHKVLQQGDIPLCREGHNMCAIQKNLYLYGGSGSLESDECLPGLYCFDTGSSIWSVCSCRGHEPRTLNSSMCAIGKALFVFGGIYDGEASSDIYMCHVDSLVWTPLKVSGIPPEPRCDHACAAVGDVMYIFGGSGDENIYFNDVFTFDTVTLTWSEVSVSGELPIPRGCHTFTAHHNKDIYVFGGFNSNQGNMLSGCGDLVKLSLHKLKWKKPLYTGIIAKRRFNHTATIVHSNLYVIGGMGDSGQFNDVSVCKLINPSDRKPIFKDLMMDMGIPSRSTEFVPTVRPLYSYELTHAPYTRPKEHTVDAPDLQGKKDLSYIRDLAKESVDKAIVALEEQFNQLNREKAEFALEKAAAEEEREERKRLYASQQEELQSMLDKHKEINEDWLENRRIENDGERRELASLRAKVIADQERLMKEQDDLAMKTKNLHSVMQQFKDV